MFKNDQTSFTQQDFKSISGHFSTIIKEMVINHKSLTPVKCKRESVTMKIYLTMDLRLPRY